MRLDHRHEVLETTARLKLVRRSNDYAVCGAITGHILAVVPFYPSPAAPQPIAEERARSIFDTASAEGWR